MHQEQTDQDTVIQAQQETIASLESQLKTLEQKVDSLLRRLYGVKSEKLDPNQLELLAGLEPSSGEIPSQDPLAEQLSKELRPARPPRERKPRLPEDLPVEEVTLIPPEVKASPQDYRWLRDQVSERLEVEPARYTLKRIIRPIYVRKNIPASKPVSSALPPTLLEGSILSPSLLAHVLVQKYCDHLPLYRQASIMEKRHGISIPRNTLSNWVKQGSIALEPLWKFIAAELEKSTYVKIDETPINYLSPGSGKTKKGYLWIYQNPQEQLILYDWQEKREAQSIVSILGNFKGVMQSDGYRAYDSYGSARPEVTQAGCWAHVRRKFYDSLKDRPQEAAPILRLIQQLYQVERRLKGKAPPTKTYYRRRQSLPILRRLRRKIRKLTTKVLPKEGLGEASRYALNQWKHLMTYVYNGEVDIDNNSVERAVRPTKIGAKNWMFIGGLETGWRSAVIYTMIENCRQLGEDPYAYLKWVFERLPTTTNQDNLADLLPTAWLKLKNQKMASL